MIDVQRQVEYLTEQRKRDRAEHEREKEADAEEMEKLRREFADYRRMWAERESRWRGEWQVHRQWDYRAQEALLGREPPFDIADRKSTRLNSSHVASSYAVFCLQNKT